MDVLKFKKAVRDYGGVAALAAHLGYHRQTVYKWIDRREVPAERVPAVSQVLGLSYGDLHPAFREKAA